MFKNTQKGIFVAVALVGAMGLGALPASAQTGGNIGVIDVAKLVQESAPGKAVLKELEAYGLTQREQLEAKGAELQGLRQQIADGQLSLSEDRLAELQSELQTKTIELQRATDDAQREFNSRQATAFKDIEGQIMPVIQQVGQESGFTMIFNKFESGLVFASESVDITDRVIARLANTDG